MTKVERCEREVIRQARAAVEADPDGATYYLLNALNALDDAKRRARKLSLARPRPYKDKVYRPKKRKPLGWTCIHDFLVIGCTGCKNKGNKRRPRRRLSSSKKTKT